MREQTVAHAAHERLVGALVEICDAILEDRHDERNHDYRHGEYPDIALSVIHSAEQVGKVGKNAVRHFIIYHAVYSEADYLRQHHV